MTVRRWAVVLSTAADGDFHEILRWTNEQFGSHQAAAYEKTLSDAIAALAEGPDIIGTRERTDVQQGLYTFHVARHGRSGRHFLLFHVPRLEEPVIEVLRVLHDGMDIARHLPPYGDDLEI